LTDLKGYDVVLGKLAATSLDAFYGLIAILPVLAIPLLLGGVSIEEFWRMSLVLTNALFFSLAAGIFVSSMSRGPRKAMAGARAVRWRGRWQHWCYGDAAARVAFRTRLLNINPCFWLAGRHRLKPALVWAFLGLSGCVWTWGALKWRNDWLHAGTYVITALL